MEIMEETKVLKFDFNCNDVSTDIEKSKELRELSICESKASACYIIGINKFTFFCSIF